MAEIPPLDDLTDLLPPCENPINYLLCIIKQTFGLTASEKSDNPTETETSEQSGKPTNPEQESRDTINEGEELEEDEEEQNRTIDDLTEGAKDVAKNTGTCYLKHC